MPANGSKWTEEHDQVLLRTVVSTVLASRRTIYSAPGLADVCGNGGSRINQKIQQLLKRMSNDPALVKAEVEAIGGVRAGRGSASRRKSAGADSDKTKHRAAGSGSSIKPAAKKRKHAESSDEEEDCKPDVSE